MKLHARWSPSPLYEGEPLLPPLLGISQIQLLSLFLPMLQTAGIQNSPSSLASTFELHQSLVVADAALGSPGLHCSYLPLRGSSAAIPASLTEKAPGPPSMITTWNKRCTPCSSVSIIREPQKQVFSLFPEGRVGVFG